jgi:hypothetical protein
VASSERMLIVDVQAVTGNTEVPVGIYPDGVLLELTGYPKLLVRVSSFVHTFLFVCSECSSPVAILSRPLEVLGCKKRSYLVRLFFDQCARN